MRRWKKAAVAFLVMALGSQAFPQSPIITVPPRSLNVGPGDRAGFVVDATGEAPLAYQWYRDGTPLVGATEELLLLPNAQTAQAGSYSVTVTNAQGSAVSAAAKLVVARYTTQWTDPSFEAHVPSLDSFLELPDGRLLAATDGLYVQLARLTANGAIDPSFNFPPLLLLQGGKIARIAAAGAAPYWIIVGTRHSSHVAESYEWALWRLNDDGSRDPAFNVVLAGGISPNVLIPDGNKVIIAFEEKLVRLNQDGSVDVTFADSTTQLASPGAWPVRCAVKDQVGNIWVGRGSYLFRLRGNGSRDETFDPVELRGTVHDVVVTSTGSFWVSTSDPANELHSPFSYGLSRWTAAGQRDPSFQEFHCEAPSTLNFFVQENGSVVVSGGFSLRQDAGENGRHSLYNAVVRLSRDGTIDASFNPPDLQGWPRWWRLADGKHAIAGTKKMKLESSGIIDPPRILQITADRPAALAGDDVTLRVVAVGAGPIRIAGGGSPLSDDRVTFRDVQEPMEVTAIGPGGEATELFELDVAASAPRFLEDPASMVARAGQIAVFTSLVRGSYPMTYEWFKDDVRIDGPNQWGSNGSQQFFIGAATASMEGTYRLRVTNSQGVSERSAKLTVGGSSELANLSVRAMVGTGERVMIVGFVSKNRKLVLLQAIGPELVPLGVSDVLADPTATLFASDLSQTTNDNGGSYFPWNDSLYHQLGATPLDAYHTKSAELRSNLSGGAHTVVVSGVGGATGVALTQIFDADETTNRLTNLSARVFAGTDSATAITGFIIRGSVPKTVLIRCVGPGLVAAGVEGALLDPHLRLVDQRTRETIRTNDDWQADDVGDELRQVMVAVGAFPLGEGSKDSAILATLAPGAYTALVSGAGGTTGVVLLEVYDVR